MCIWFRTVGEQGQSKRRTLCLPYGVMCAVSTTQSCFGMTVPFGRFKKCQQFRRVYLSNEKRQSAPSRTAYLASHATLAGDESNESACCATIGQVRKSCFVSAAIRGGMAQPCPMTSLVALVPCLCLSLLWQADKVQKAEGRANALLYVAARAPRVTTKIESVLFLFLFFSL